MRTKGARTEKINVVTLGCSKNIYDSEVLMAQLKANQFSVEHESETEDFHTVIINTCGFIDNAKEESVNTILQFSDAKKKGWVEKVIVTGCLSERYKEDLEKEIPEVDAWFGTRDLPRLLKTLKADYKHELVGERFLTTPIHYAYLKISEGCDRPCTFCAIPLMRGKHKSTPIEDLVKQAKSLAAQGTRELILIAQDSTYYGLDIYGKRNLAALLQRLSEVEGIDWIRLHYAYPSGFPMDVIQEMAKNPKICNYLDIPLQHINDDMLKSMKRVTTREKTDRILNEMRSINPEMGIRTTLITGFPGETLEQFNEMRDWVAEMKFDRLGVFTYSHEENTGAYVLEDNVPQEEKQRRADEIMSIQEGISQ
ncbi:MAG: 30S ribosomal protein S12 methylthiotransferase RimO, partial [Bacteroidetes bacterium]|nr:30S ribosomal protein S12 methylthiotransferase RimO [Bacteroidota bacterium]